MDSGDGEKAILHIKIRLKVMPEQWKVEVICPVSKSGSPACRTDDVRPIKLQEVAKKFTMSTVKERLRRVLENSGILEAQHGFRPGRVPTRRPW